ncbi:MAG: hypothetical protein DMF69_15535 [Acidobacteria bacterium]|nr:MAG: hypothetical protein DMF69_15535 [Acidobacteriota bacterium]
MDSTKNRLMAIASTLFVGALVMGMHTSVFAQGDSDLNRQLAQARAATAKYHDVLAALEDGFVVLPPGICEENSNGALGIHYINVPRFLSPDVNELEPEFLNYMPTGDGNIRLVSLAYGNRVLFRDTRPPDTPGYRPGLFPWQQAAIPPYLEEVSGAFSLFGQPAEGPTFEGRWVYLITVNIWAPNPLGMFVEGNPRLTCPTL